MTPTGLARVLKGIAPVVKEYVTDAVVAFTARLEAVEARPLVHGKDGAIGPVGEKGSSFFAGDGDPSSEGRAGDVYLDVKTGDVYRCT